MRDDLPNRMDCLILGASARAAAHSALRAGLRPMALDLFADRDLAAVATARRIPPEAYPDGLEALADAAPPGPWLYTGGLENHPDLIDRIASTRPLWGNSGATVRAVRDPFRLARVLRDAGLPTPSVQPGADGLPRDGSWLVKPFASAGGLGIRRLVLEEEARTDGHYYQERIDGQSLAAVFVGEEAGARLLGVTRQAIGSVGDHEFTYRGSLGPWPLSLQEHRAVERLGRAVSEAFGLVGLFGIDLILRDGLPWPVEVNPRYTASVEVLELALGRPLLAEHVRACLGESGRDWERRLTRPAGFVGKAIVFATRPIRFPGSIAGRPTDGLVPRLADVPRAGTLIRPGDPVLTLLARGVTLEACRRRLEHRLARWEARLFGSTAAVQGSPPCSNSSSTPHGS